MSAPHQHFPYFKYRARKTGSFSSVSNQVTVTDGDVLEESIIVIANTSSRNGVWHYVIASGGGSFVVHSSVVEDGTPTFSYEIL